MTRPDESVWRGRINSGSCIGASGRGARFGRVAELEALTGTHIAPCPFPKMPLATR